MNINGAGFDVNLFYTLKSSGETGPAAENPQKTGAVLPAQERRKTDSVEISARRGEDSGTFLTELKKKLSENIAAQPGAGRLQSLQDEIAGGTYGADSGELAQLMLE